MPGYKAKRFRSGKQEKPERPQKRKREHVDLEQLEQNVQELDIENGSFKDFTDLPLSAPTRAGLKAAHFTTLTDIQRKAVPLALRGRDILGAAKTGSGKTLAFLVPVLENLYRAQHIGPDAGLGAMIVSPTRELAIQIFEVLRSVGGHGHMFAAGLVIGGKSLAEEQGALARMNIVVCTPGRMLQHLSQTATFDVDMLRVLVLDEADRILDMGFQKEVDAIVEYLPRDRQTMLFSATQTKRVSDLARLSLQDPAYVAVHEEAATATPRNLQQNYVVTPLSEKLDTLWSFLQNAKKSKIIVFLSSGKQVRFVYEAFRRMQPGIPLLHLHGRQKQGTRLEITKRFTTATTSCLFATDVAARGLDFPAVDWVVQLDCPEDADTYIHRVGRTARYEREGRAILFLDQSEEEGMLKRLEAKKVPIEKVNAKQKKKSSIKNILQNMCFKDNELKYLGQKAFASYVRSVYVQKDKEIFKMDQLPLEDFAASLGLPGAPRIKFMKGDDPKARKNAPRAQVSASDDSDASSHSASGSENEGPSRTSKVAKASGVRTKYDRMFERRNQDVLGDHRSKLLANEQGSDLDEQVDDITGAASDLNGAPLPTNGDDDFLTVKQRIPAITDPLISSDIDADDDEGNNNDNEHSHITQSNNRTTQSNNKLVKIHGISQPLLVDSARALKRLTSKKALLKYRDKNERLVFDDDGIARPLYQLQSDDYDPTGSTSASGAAAEKEAQRQKERDEFVAAERDKVRLHDVADKARVKERKRDKKIRRKERERDERFNNAATAAATAVAVADGEDGGTAPDLVRQFLDDTMADADADDDDGVDVVGDEDVGLGRPGANKEKKKWFQKDVRPLHDNDDDVADDGREMDFEDLERMASGLIES